MVKNSKIPKNLKNLHFINKKKIAERKKCYPFSFPILGGRNSTKALKSSPFQNPGGGTLSVTDGGEEEEEGNPCV